MDSASTRPANRILRFALVGASGVLLHTLILWLAVDGIGAHYGFASIISIEVATLSNYFLNRMWTWNDQNKAKWSLVNYHGITAIGALIQWVVMVALVESTGIHYLLGSFIGVLIAFAWNFTANDKLTFGNNPELARRVGIYTISGALHLLVAILWTQPWDAYVFQQSVRDFLLHGLTPYEVTVAQPAYIYQGLGEPGMASWYAYPPLAFLTMLGSYGPFLGAEPWLARLLIKLPLIASSLAMAYLAGKIAKKHQARVEAALLLNPLTILIAAGWGQLEPMMMVFLLLMFLALRKDRYGRAGAAFGAAVLVKIFPLYLAPLLMIAMLRRDGFKAFAKFTAFAAGVIGSISLPFFLHEPHGFYQAVLGMHMDRPPGHFSPTAYLYEALPFLFPGLAPHKTTLGEVLGGISFVVMVSLIIVIAFASLARAPTQRQLYKWSAWTAIGTLVAGKVLNEQYLILPLVLLAIQGLHRGAKYTQLFWAMAWTISIAAIIDSVHFIRFMPHDITESVFGMNSAELTHAFAEMLGTTTATLMPASRVLAALLTFPLLWMLLKELKKPLKLGLLILPEGASKAPVVAGIFVVISTLVVPTFAGTQALQDEPQVSEATYAYYRTDWYNPFVNPDEPAGNWEGIQEIPLDGFYTVTANKIRSDFEALQAGGINEVIIQLRPEFILPAERAYEVASELGMNTAWSIKGTRTPVMDWEELSATTTIFVQEKQAIFLEVDDIGAWHQNEWQPVVLTDWGDINVWGTTVAASMHGYHAMPAQGLYVLPWNDFGRWGGVEPTKSAPETFDLKPIRQASTPPKDPAHGDVKQSEPKTPATDAPEAPAPTEPEAKP